MPSTPDRPDMTPLFTSLQSRFSSSSSSPSLPPLPEKWFVLAAAALVSSPDPEACSALYIHLTTALPQYSTPPQRHALVRRLREALFKCVIITGVCKPLEAIMAISGVERDEDKDPLGGQATREGWQCDDANLERGTGWLRRIYAGNTDSTLDLFRDHRDFAWVSRHITYGLFLSDRQVLDDLDTELVVLAAIMMQNLPLETRWHIRGIRRLGVAKEDVRMIWECVWEVARFTGVDLNRVPTVDEVEGEV